VWFRCYDGTIRLVPEPPVPGSPEGKPAAYFREPPGYSWAPTASTEDK
jgi:hypothetical protein